MSTMTRAPAGQPLEVSPATSVKNYMVYAILCTVLLFVPTGVTAIYFAAKVKPAQRAGNVPEALEASRKAKLFCQISLLVGVILWPIVIMTIVAAGGDPSGSGLWYS
jgi:Interferon-induced transmembrane protein